MARREIIVHTDDLDGSDVDVTAVRFGFEGREYEIDLGPDNRKQLAEALAPFVAAARRVSKPAPASADRRGPAYNAAARDWLKNNGYDAVTDRGRIATRLLAAYDSKTPKA